MSLQKGVSAEVFNAIQNIDMEKLATFSEAEIRPILPCLVRMGLISPLDLTKQCSDIKGNILKIICGIELVNSIVALLSIEFHNLETDVRNEQQLRLKGNTNRNDSVLIGNLSNTSIALEYERSDMSRRSSILLGELLYIQSQIQEPVEKNKTVPYMKSSELFEIDIFVEELSDVICIVLAELPTTLNIINIVEILLHISNGPEIICRIVANFPDSFREVCTYLIQTGEKQEESMSSMVRIETIRLLCNMNPSQSLMVRTKCAEVCKMPALAILLSLGQDKEEGDLVAFVSGLLLGNDQTTRNWMIMFIRTGQKKKGEASSQALQKMREELMNRLQHLIDLSPNKHIPASLVFQATTLLRLYCALRGIAAIKFQDDEISLLIELLTSHPPCTPAGVRFLSIGLSMLIACPSLISQSDHEKRSIEWIKWIIRKEEFIESSNAETASFGEMLLLMATYFHSQQFSAICELTCGILGMKIPIRHNNMNRMKQIFTQEIFTEQVVTEHVLKVPVTKQLNGNMTGFLPIHFIHQLLKSRAFTKHKVNVKNWIYKQICASVKPLHPVLPMLVEAYVASLISAKNNDQVNYAFSENELRHVYQNSIFSEYLESKTVFILDNTKDTVDLKNVLVDTTSLAPQLIMLYYVLLYEDYRLNNIHALTAAGKKMKPYAFMTELPIKYLLYQSQKDKKSYFSIFGPLLKLVATHFPQLTLIDDWINEWLRESSYRKPPAIDELMGTKINEYLSSAFNEIDVNPSKCSILLQTMLNADPIDMWRFAEGFSQFGRKLLGESIPRHLQDLYKDVWLRLNTVMPRRLWVLTVKNLVDDYSYVADVDIADPLKILRCDERVFRCKPLYLVLLKVLRASLASSRRQLAEHMQANPKLDAHGQTIPDPDKEEMYRAAVQSQDCAVVLMLLETLVESEDDRTLPGRQWALEEVRALVCSYLHETFLADVVLFKLVHFQGYPTELLETLVKRVPSMHVAYDFLAELMQQPSLNKQILAVQVIAHLCIPYSLTKSLNWCVTGLNLLFALLGSVSSSERYRLFKPILPSLTHMTESFPALTQDVVNLLIQLGRICESQAAFSHFDCQRSRGLEISARESEELSDLVKKTFIDILDKGALKSKLYKQE